MSHQHTKDATRTNTPRQSQYITNLHREIVSKLSLVAKPHDDFYEKIKHQIDDDRWIEVISYKEVKSHNKHVVYTVTNIGPKPSDDTIIQIYQRAGVFGHFVQDFGNWLENLNLIQDFSNWMGSQAESHHAPSILVHTLRAIGDDLHDFIKLYDGVFKNSVNLEDYTVEPSEVILSYVFTIRAEAANYSVPNATHSYPILSLRISEQLLEDYISFYRNLTEDGSGDIVDTRSKRYVSRNDGMEELLCISKPEHLSK